MLLLARLEFGRLVLSRRGWLSLLAFALIWSLVVIYTIVPAAGWLENPEFGGLAGALIDRAGLQEFDSFGTPEVALYWLIAPWLLPLFAIVVAADQMASLTGPAAACAI